MIAFKKGEEPNDLEDFVIKLEKVLSKIYEDSKTPTFEEVNLSELLEIVYFNLYVENNNYINISIKKEKNNLLKFKIEKTK